MNIIGTFIYLIIGYLLGVAFTDFMFIDLALTQWSNLMTYVWIFCWPIMLLISFWIIVLIILGLAFIADSINRRI